MPLIGIIVQRLLADAVPRQYQAVLLPVIQCDRKHTVKAVEHVVPPLGVGVQDYLRVTV